MRILAKGNLKQGPQWAMFQNDVCRVFGVACKVRDLVGEHDSMIEDKWKREISAFVGYAALRDQEAAFPALPSCSNPLASFAHLYELVRPHWRDNGILIPPPDYLEPIEERNRADDWLCQEPSDALVYDMFRRTGAIRGTRAFKPRQDPPAIINTDPDQIALWRDSLFVRTTLWRSISRLNKPISICFSLPDPHDIQKPDNPFMNATVIGLSERSLRAARQRV
jgi:hypothetical protein